MPMFTSILPVDGYYGHKQFFDLGKRKTGATQLIIAACLQANKSFKSLTNKVKYTVGISDV